MGTGYSWVQGSNFATSDDQIAQALVRFATQFFNKYPQFQQVPFYVFCESYGGKMTAVFGEALHKAIKAGQVRANFAGVSLGDGWVDPLACVSSYGEYLRALSLVDDAQAAVIDSYASQMKQALDANNGVEATNLWGQQQQYIESVCDGCNFYNSINSTDLDAQENQMGINCAPGGWFYQQVQSVIPSNVVWGAQGNQVFEALSNAFMRPAVTSVEYLIANGLDVNVVSGQLDLIVDGLCTDAWINQMSNWTGLAQWQQAPNNPVSIQGVPQAFVQQYQNFRFWRILRAGHMVPNDNPPVAFLMAKTILKVQ